MSRDQGFRRGAAWKISQPQGDWQTAPTKLRTAPTKPEVLQDALCTGPGRYARKDGRTSGVSKKPPTQTGRSTSGPPVPTLGNRPHKCINAGLKAANSLQLERGCVPQRGISRSTSKRTTRKHQSHPSPPLGRCDWSGGHSRAPSENSAGSEN